MNITPQAIQILNQVKEDIHKHSDQFYMHDWDCGTTACIAGWICRRAGKSWIDGLYDHPSVLAPQLLRMDATYLFYTACWPRQLQSAYRDAPCNCQKAEVACQAIDAFIADPLQFGPQD